jgi:monothiol glutaredoxin
MEVMERIQKQVDSAAIVLYMKGTPQFPQCGFSAINLWKSWPIGKAG